MEISDHLQSILDSAPTKSGCYLMKDVDGKVIYVGKAINLRSRVRSYFHNNVDSIKTQRLRRDITDIEIITTDTDLEALLLEMTLIKKHKPHFNVRLKDDKRYPYIKVHWADPFPKVTVTRRMAEAGQVLFQALAEVGATVRAGDPLGTWADFDEPWGIAATPSVGVIWSIK